MNEKIGVSDKVFYAVILVSIALAFDKVLAVRQKCKAACDGRRPDLESGKPVREKESIVRHISKAPACSLKTQCPCKSALCSPIASFVAYLPGSRDQSRVGGRRIKVPNFTRKASLLPCAEAVLSEADSFNRFNYASQTSSGASVAVEHLARNLLLLFPP